MTEEQLLAQSADDYMNAGQLEFFKQRLLEKATSVRERIAANQSLCICLLYTSPSPRDLSTSRMPSSA